ncbi:rootletin-like [Perca fluviatilis]|uniref:rootletin-like n=1 Tax=Perca fluviatilis TaxID=8168 RepID=UPI0019639B99|nr:rootletin-like [Perca fluviatilis]
MSSQRDQGAHSPRLEAVIQKLEESLLHSDGSSGERTLTLQGDGEGSGVTSVSTRIRQIITRNLAEQSAGASSEVSELEENRALREQLSQSQMDRDQPLVKQLDQMLMLDSDQDSVSPGSLQLHIKERAYRQKLRAYQEAQQRQGQLVQKLQTKVLQYKKRCGELEEQVLEKTSESEKMRLLLQAHLDSAQRQQRTEQG